MNIKFFKFFLAITFLSFIYSNKSLASHGMGMDLTYQCLGGNTYQFQLAFYRDCGGVAAPTTPIITLSSASCSQTFTRPLIFVSSGETTPVCASLTTECQNGTFPGAEEYIYRASIVLPFQCPDWVISYSVCCRNNDINTINAPGSANIYTETTLNNTLTPCNSSPSFSNDPVPFVCANQTYCFNNGAIDADGDSLVYSLVTPKTNPALGDTVVFLPGFSAKNPITSTPQLSLDPITGDLCMFPTDSNQIGVLAVLVEEYRNGVKIGSIRRDIQLRILGCPNGNNSPTVTGIDSTSVYNIKVCAGDTLDFNVFSQDLDPSQTVTMTWNNAIATATFNITGGNRPVGNFIWSPLMTEIRANPYCFTVTVKDDNCPFNGSQVFSYCIAVTGVTSLVDSIASSSCNSFCDGIGAVQIVNGTPPYTYQWNDPMMQNTPIAKNLCAGIYSIIGTDSVGCQTTTTLAITEPDTLAVIGKVVSNYNGRDVSCFGSSDGQISGLASGGNPPYSYIWGPNTGNQTGDTATGLGSGTYFFTITDSKGCDTSGTIVVNDPPPINGQTQVFSDYNGRMISCVGASDGILVASGFGGTGQLSFQWDSSAMNQVTDTASGLPAGVYEVTIFDLNSCDTSLKDSLLNPPALFANASLFSNYNGSSISCNGSSDGILVADANGGTPGYTYQWGANSGSQVTDTATNLSAGIYSVIAKDTNGCLAEDTIALVEPDSLIINILSKTNVYCNGQNTGKVTVTSTGGTQPYSYSWNTTPVVNDSIVINLGMGSYTVTVTDSNGCTSDSIINILESQPIVANITGIDLKCNVAGNGMAYSTPTGGNPPFNYRWTTNIGIQGSDTARNLSASTHYLKITDAFNCTLFDSIQLNAPPPVNITTSGNDTICTNTPVNISAIATGGTGNQFSYQWNQGLGTGQMKTVSPNATTLYIVNAVDSIGCLSPPGVITIYIRDFSEDSLILSTSGSPCQGDTAFVMANHIAKFDKYIYDWTPGQGTDAGPIPVSPDTATYYKLSVTDICGNEIIDSVFVDVLPNPIIELPDTIAIGCNPLQIEFFDSLNAGKNYQYVWSFGDNKSSIDPVASHLYTEPGIYTIGLSATSPNGCTTNDQSASMVHVLNAPIVKFLADPISTTTQNPVITFTNKSTFSNDYLWSFGDDSSSIAENPIHTYQDSGFYQVWLIGYNDNGCLDSANQFIQIEPYFEIVIPNAFTPNPNYSSGGKYDPESLDNDVFRPHTTGVGEYQLTIFNRWGELIFESKALEIGWDGYYKNELAQQEVYIYKLNITWINGQKLKTVGDITLLR